MEIPSEMISKIQQNSTYRQKSFDFNSPEYKQNNCDIYNNTVGHLNEIDGYNCKLCKNRGNFEKVVDDEIIIIPCKCKAVHKSLRIIKACGLQNNTFDNFNCYDTWVNNILDECRNFADNSKKEWIFIGGQSGAGKTHLCTAILREYVLRYQVQCEILRWQSDAKKLKQIANDEQYQKQIEKYKTCRVLYIDDFFKSKSTENITHADVSLAFEIIDYRYTHNFKTIISSELSLDEICGIDEALGGRIYEQCQGNVLYIPHDTKKNYRLKGKAKTF